MQLQHVAPAVLVLVGGLACGGSDDRPDPETVFPYVYTPETDLPQYAHVRWETETWGPTDLQALDYATKTVNHWPGAPVESIEHFASMGAQMPPLGEGIVLSFVGDILWIDGNWGAFATATEELLAADLRFGNLETPASAEHPVQNDGLPIRFNAPPEMLDALPLDVLQLNNNHSIDMDDAGLESTKAQAEQRGYQTTGVDEHLVVDVKEERVALLSFTWGVNRRDIASEHELFIVPFGHLDEEIDLSKIERAIIGARADGATLVVVTVHWGYEYEYYPDPHYLVLARRIIALGADLIVGQGPHVVQPAELCHVNRPEHAPGVGSCSVETEDGVPRTAAVLYSLGNFTNDTPARPEVEVGIAAKVSLRGGVTGVGWTPVLLKQDPVRVEPADWSASDPRVAAELERLDGHLGAGWRIAAPAP